MARIRFDQVTKRYGGVVAVDRLDLEIRDKEFLVLLGPSGCGKSTTLNMIAGLEDLSDGDLYFDDEIVNVMPPHRRDVAMVFQSYALYPHKSVRDNIAFGLKMRRLPADEIAARVGEAAERLEIAHLLDRRPHQLSGGQRQRVALGRAMVRRPAVFLMDEPLSNLDAALRITMRAEIKQLHRTMGTTFVYVTHDQAEALTLADRIVVMKDGVVQQIGTPDEIYERPRNLFVASFLGNPPINLIEGRLNRDGGGLGFQRDGATIRLSSRVAAGIAAHADRPITLGIRPEDVQDRAVQADDCVVTGAVKSVLPVGSDQYLGIAFADRELFFRIGKNFRHGLGETVTLALDPARLHWFDPATAAALEP
ncbi:MAG: ABC transporter ATP-binding protein [Proteobacteria bacterium]|nr:ABC transporter ATP-binding protein [Pseudomonadota bacterium]